ncbi:MAG: hypothetical protein QXU16_02830 [Candidatus Micrarchaeaceae archaeon]
MGDEASNLIRAIFGSSESARSWFRSNIDATLLYPYSTDAQFEEFAESSVALGIKHICIPVTKISLVANVVSSASIYIVAVVGFPYGNMSTTSDKVSQVEFAASSCAAEIDFVCDISMFRSDKDAFRDQLEKIVSSAHAHGMLAKGILETYYLSNSEITEMSSYLEGAGADFVKTSTGFAIKGKNHPDRNSEYTGFAPDTVPLIAVGVVSKELTGIKLAGGIGNAEQALSGIKACIDAGWKLEKIRIGASSAKSILEGIG